MQKIEYDLPIFNNEDVADLNEYSQLVANALKVQIDKFGNPLTFKGTVETPTELQSLINMKNGDIYLVKNENKNYIYNGTEWVIYSDNIGATINILIVEELPTQNINAKAIYLILKDSEATNNIYNEYIYVNGNWELIGSTEIDPSKLTVNLVENSYKLTLTQAVAGGGTITVPSNYKVGLDRLDVFLNGEKLIKASSNDEEGHYYEVGTEGTLSNMIRITNDWSAKVGDVFEFTIRTNGQGVTEESLDIYSTNEQIVGKWIDGKTIYRKVINYIPTSTDYNYNHNIKNISEILPMSTLQLHRVNGQFVPSLYYDQAPNEWSIGYQFTKVAVVTWIGNEMFKNMINPGVTAILYYTKITD